MNKRIRNIFICFFFLLGIVISNDVFSKSFIKQDISISVNHQNTADNISISELELLDGDDFLNEKSEISIDNIDILHGNILTSFSLNTPFLSYWQPPKIN